MNRIPVKAFSRLPLEMIVALGCAALSSAGNAAPGLSVGACVTVRQQPGPATIIAVTPGGYVVQREGKTASEAMNWAQGNVDTGPCPSAAAAAAQRAQPHECLASDADSKGATAAERSFRAVIRRSFERNAAPGSDGAVTITFQSFRIGAARRWLTSDGYNFSSDQRKPIYDLRVSFTTCTDYRTAIEISRQERNFQCFTAPTGGASCQVSGSTAGMARDSTQRIAKL